MHTLHLCLGACTRQAQGKLSLIMNLGTLYNDAILMLAKN